MLIPELPDYLTSLGGEDYKGLIISLFTVTAGLSRPFSGRLTDKIGRVPVMAFGSIVCFVCGFFYPIVTTIFPFLLLRFVHGFSTGFKPTGTAAYIADIMPFNRRGEAMGLHGLVSSLGMAFGPAIGSWIAQEFSLNVLFYVSSVFALLSIVILANMKETLDISEKQPFNLNALKINKDDVFDKQVLPAAIVVFFTAFCYGPVVTLTPDLSKYLSISNKGYYFMLFTLASLVVRLVAGKWSDKNGRVVVLQIGCFVLILSSILLAFSQSNFLFSISALLFGVAMGIISPISQAWTVDLSDEKYRGRALATMYIALESGIGIGAILSAWIYNNKSSNFIWAFSCSVLSSAVSLGYLIYYKKKKVDALK